MARISRKNGMHMAMWSGVARAHHGSHLGVAMARGRERGRTEDSALENPRKVTRSAGNSCNPISGGLGRGGAERSESNRGGAETHTRNRESKKGHTLGVGC